MSTVKHTLTELIVRNFIDAKKKAARRKNSKTPKRKNKAVRDRSSISAVISNILTNLRINEFENKEKEPKDQEQSAQEEPEEESVVHGGYGTVKPYAGMSPYSAYVNYDKIWGHVGTFRSQSMYDKINEGFFSQTESKSTGVLVDNKVIEKAERHFKYFMPGDLVGDVGYVPPVGTRIDSRDWEKYKIMTQMSFYRSLLALFRAIV